MRRIGALDRERVAAELRELAMTHRWSATGLHPASVGQERVHLLASAGQDQPSLYLVSDGAGVVSPPHEHETWAVIAGISGIELNVVYARVPGRTREVEPIGDHRVGPGDVLVLDAASIHSTAVDGAATYHLHL